MLADAELVQMLAEVDEQRGAITAELAAVEKKAKAAESLRAARDSLAAGLAYGPAHAEWEQDPDAVMPGEVLTHATHPEDIRRAYRKYGARFEVDGQGTLTLRLSLGLGEPGEPLQTGQPSQINGRYATHAPLLYVRTRLSDEEEPQAEVTLSLG